ncbi:PLP-dependent aminotransferase family protein [Cellulomonas sp. NPDC089187]|uniref:aminotransferase-like domain-containing protein n=1 Tax=Cellulomonas sp. NPDC089187 TaxID=3154970 RepID=UPI00342DB881
MPPRIDPAELVRLLGHWQDPDAGQAEPLRAGLADLIRDGALPAGARMPAQRAVASALGIARGTVDRVYQALAAEGLVTAQQGSGTYVQRPARRHQPHDGGRLSSFTAAPEPVDLSSGALPAAPGVTEVFAEVAELLARGHAHRDGYFPAGLPELRTTLAESLTADGVPTTPEQLLITAGSQQAVWLVGQTVLGAGDTVVTEDPTYRGALGVFSATGARIRAVPTGAGGVDLGLLGSALVQGPRLLYLQTALHNPTGVHTGRQRRTAIGQLLAGTDTLVLDDQSCADLPRTRSGRLGGMDGRVDPTRLITVGTTSKLFWGGLRIGWIRADPSWIRRLTATRSAVDLGSAVADQLAVSLLLPRTAELRADRRDLLEQQYRLTAQVLAAEAPDWSWSPPDGGSGLWVETGQDAVLLASRAQSVGVRLAPGPAFSAYEGHRTRLRLPLWHEPGLLAGALRRIGAVDEG